MPIVSSQLVPFVTEYLLGNNVKEAWYDKEKQDQPLRQGCGAIIVPAGDVAGFAHALEMWLTDGDLRQKTGEEAYQVTIPYFSWRRVVDNFLDKIGVPAT